MDVAVIGASGSVGRAVCMQLLATGAISPGERLQLVGHRGGASETGAHGPRIDLLDAYAHTNVDIEVVLDGENIDADVVVMVAGQTPAEDPRIASNRDAVAEVNLPLFEHYAQVLKESCPRDELVIIQSNPVELAVDVFADALGTHRVVGAGSYNDTLRFRRELAMGVPEGSRPVITGFMLGEHGPHAVPVWSSVRAGGMPSDAWDRHFESVRSTIPLAELPQSAAKSRQQLAELIGEHRAEEAAAFVDSLTPEVRALVRPWFAHWSGRTSTATAHSAVDLVAALQTGHRVVMPLQVQVTADTWPGVDSVIGLPVDIDAAGWHSVVEIPLDDDEREALVAAGHAVTTQLEQWRNKV